MLKAPEWYGGGREYSIVTDKFINGRPYYTFKSDYGDEGFLYYFNGDGDKKGFKKIKVRRF